MYGVCHISTHEDEGLLRPGEGCGQDYSGIKPKCNAQWGRGWWVPPCRRSHHDRGMRGINASITDLQPELNTAFHPALFRLRETLGSMSVDSHGHQWHGGTAFCGRHQLWSPFSGGFRCAVERSAGEFSWKQRTASPSRTTVSSM